MGGWKGGCTSMKTQLYRQIETDQIVGEDKQYAFRIQDLPIEEKPREKLVKFGPDVLSMAELLAVMFTVGSKKEGVLGMSNRLLKEYGEKAILNQKDAKKMAKELDIPLIKACQMIASFELGRRFYKPDSGRPEFLRSAKQVYDYLQDMANLPKEHLRGLYLNPHYRLIHDEVISIGSLTSNIIHPREVFKPALEHSASALILAHNHPSGNATPSDADIQITKQIVDAGKILGIGVLDHIIVTKDGFQSIEADYS